MLVRSVAIDWQEKTLSIMDKAGQKHTVPLDKRIRVTMVGYDRENQTMQARDLGRYMSGGYIIERIDYEEEN